jgi:predicted nucleic acid-binding protein
MILYLDTSALLKRYFREVFSEKVISSWKRSAAIVTSAVAYAETVASIYRKKREISSHTAVCDSVKRTFDREWESFVRIEVNNELNPYVDRLVQSHPLRGFDAIHLASAVIVQETLSEEILFACFEKRLLDAARFEGFKTLPEHL